MGGMGMGMMGGMHGAPFDMLDLTPEQRTKINKIHDELRRKNWDALGKVQDEEAKLRDLILVPILHDHYGRVLEAGEITLDRTHVQFRVRYRDHALPLAPRTLRV
jgi:hypothetical protein